MRAKGLQYLAVATATLAIGFAYSALVMGPRLLDPAYVDWLKGDPLEHYLGWLFFTQTHGWSFPFNWSDRLGYPVGSYLSLIDPALLVTFGPFSHLLPSSGQYLGLFFAVNTTLQLYWGFRLTQLLARGDNFAAVIGGLLFLLSPIMAQKAQGHFSGGCHWPILAALFYLLRDKAITRPFVWTAPFGILIAFSAVIHPYLGASICMIAWVALLRLRVERRVSIPQGLLLFAACPAVFAASLYAIGILGVGGGAAADGFQDYSLNLLSPVNSMPYKSLLPLHLPNFPPQEFEGYAYLGLGVLGLLLAVVLRWKRPRVADEHGKRIAIAALFAGCLVVAVSNRLTLGHHVLFEYPLPGPLLFVANAFRAPARFIWPAYYLLTGLTVAGVTRRWPPGAARTLLVAAVILQFFDLAGLRNHVRHFQASPSSDPDVMHEWSTAWPGPSDIWNEIGRDHAHLAVLPAWQCDGDNGPGGDRSYAIFGRLAATLNMTLNEYRASRYTPASLIAHCQTIPDAVAQGHLQSDTAYVLNDFLFLSVLASGNDTTHKCSRVDGYNLCLASPGGMSDWTPVVPAIPLGQTVSFAKGSAGLGFLSSAWQRAEPWGVWSRSADAALILPLANPGAVDLTITLHPLLAAQRPTQEVRLSSHGKPITQWTLAWDSEQNPKRIHIPSERVPANGLLELTLSVDEVRSPRQLGYPGDDRPLGVGLVRITIDAPNLRESAPSAEQPSPHPLAPALSHKGRGSRGHT